MSTLKKRTILLIHPIPTPYRQGLFNELDVLLNQHGYTLFIAYEYNNLPRRSFWKDTTIKSTYSQTYLSTWKIRANYLGIITIPNYSVYKQLSLLKPRLIICTGFSLNTLVSLFIRWVNNIPLIVWTGEREIRGFAKPLRIIIRKFVLKYTSHLLTYGTATENFFHNRFNIPKSKMTTLLNLIPVQHAIDIVAQIKSKTELFKRGALKLIFVGDLVRRKGIYYIPALLDRLLLTLPNYTIELTIIGDGPEKKLFQASLNKFLEERVVIRFLGKIPNKQVLDEIARCHFLLFPTLGEPWGHVITEAFSVGTPVLTSRFAGAVPDMLREGENGCVVDFDNPKLVAKKVSILINDIKKYQEMCSNAQKSYHEIFNSLDNARTMANVIMQELGYV